VQYVLPVQEYERGADFDEYRPHCVQRKIFLPASMRFDPIEQVAILCKFSDLQ
jgi:hypothetical protein